MQCIRDEKGLIVAWTVGMSEDDILEMLMTHKSWYLSWYDPDDYITEEYRR